MLIGVPAVLISFLSWLTPSLVLIPTTHRCSPDWVAGIAGLNTKTIYLQNGHPPWYYRGLKMSNFVDVHNAFTTGTYPNCQCSVTFNSKAGWLLKQNSYSVRCPSSCHKWHICLKGSKPGYPSDGSHSDHWATAPNAYLHLQFNYDFPREPELASLLGFLPPLVLEKNLWRQVHGFLYRPDVLHIT